MVQKFMVPIKMLLVATLLICGTQAGVVRIDASSKVAVQSSSEKNTMEAEVETTTANDLEDAVDVVTESLSSEALPPLAVTRDEGATIVITYQASLDPAPGTVEDSEVLLEPLQRQENKTGIKNIQQKSAPLLLLSAPKINEKPKEQEENIEEPEDDLPQDGETTEAVTEELDVSTTAMPMLIEKLEEDVSKAGNTPLAPLNETLKTQCGALKTADAATPPLQQQENLQSVPNDKFGSAFLVADVESDYVLVHGDAEDFGSFTHIDSEEHLQPIVQSVEIVPTSVDEALIVNYVQSW